MVSNMDGTEAGNRVVDWGTDCVIVSCAMFRRDGMTEVRPSMYLVLWMMMRGSNVVNHDFLAH